MSLPSSRCAAFQTVLVGGIPTSRATRSELAQAMVADFERAKSPSRPLPQLVFSSNGYVVSKFHSDTRFRELILQADMVDADGMSLVLATRILCRRPLTERVATTDFVHDAADAAISHGIRFYFLGGAPGVAERAAGKLRQKHPGLMIVGTRHGYFETKEVPDLCGDIVDAGTDVLWVGLGSPRQEAFAVANRERLCGLTWIRTCGGLFDHCSGSVPRASTWMQKAGLEWLHRALLEPQRLGPRYLTSNPLAAYHLLTKTRG